MKDELKRASELLKNGNFTLAAVRGADTVTSTERGVKPLLKLLDEGSDLRGAFAADKVIGKAAAFLYVILSPEAIYAGVISEPAFEVLKKNGIYVEYEELVPAVRNRDNTGFCPMETAVRDTDDPNTALKLIREKLRQLNK